MGEGVMFRCRNCGHEEEFVYGIGFMFGGRPETRKDVLDGKYGPRPKRIAQQNPDAICRPYSPLFHCTCGNLSVKEAVCITDGWRPIYNPSMKCNLCGRKMWEISEVPDMVLCPKCSHFMTDRIQTMLWDRCGRPIFNDGADLSFRSERQ